MQYSKEKLERLRKRWTTPTGKKLVKIIKSSRCYLSHEVFRQKAKGFSHINDKEVAEAVDLRGINLSGFDFRVPIKDDDGFAEEVAILSNIHFEGAVLKHCSFEDGKIHDCFFEGADLNHSEMKNASVNTCNFQESNFTGVNLNNSKIINCKFDNTTLRDMSLQGVIIDQKTDFGKDLKSEKEDNFHFASVEYKQIKEMYKNSSLHDLADLYHHKEMAAKRKTIPKTHPRRWINYIFGDLLCKYGTSFLRVILGSLLIILVCAFLYNINNSLLYHNAPIQEPTMLNSLYFSIVTFTTLGYGDFHAVGGMRFLAAAESFTGAALMALFTVIVARNIIRD